VGCVVDKVPMGWVSFGFPVLVSFIHYFFIHIYLIHKRLHLIPWDTELVKNYKYTNYLDI